MTRVPVSELRVESLSSDASTDSATLLESVVAQSGPPRRAEGVAIGRLEGLSEDGAPLVSIDAWGLQALSARTLVMVAQEQLGQQVALGFEAGDPLRPIVLGVMLPTEPQTQKPGTGVDVSLDGTRLVLQAEREIELRCGEAALIMTADGQIQLRGTYITSYASATQRILGGSVNLN